MHLFFQILTLAVFLFGCALGTPSKPDRCPFMIYPDSVGTGSTGYSYDTGATGYSGAGPRNSLPICYDRMPIICSPGQFCPALNSEERFLCTDDYDCPEGTLCCYSYCWGSGKQCLVIQVSQPSTVTGEVPSTTPSVTPPLDNCQTSLGCVRCINSSLCTQCEDSLTGPLQDGSGGCGPCADQCSHCSGGAGTCDSNSCNSGFYYDNKTASCPACAEHCEYCSGSEPGYCSFCNQGYGLVYQGCAACTIKHCANCNGDVDDCSYCEDGFAFTTERTCEACAENCNYCYQNGPSDCDYYGCVEGFIYVSESRSCQACTAECTSCRENGPGTCDKLACSLGFTYVNETQTCEACGENCLACDIAGTDSCDPSGCNISFAFDSTSDQCQPCSDNCAVCSSKGTCNECYNGFGFQGSNNDKCTACPRNCLTCHKRKCDMCEYGFGLTTNLTCEVCNTLSGCLDCIQTYVCTDCNQYQYGPLLDGSGGCAPCASNCQNCLNMGAGRCDLCEYSYGISDDGSCTACADVHCSNCDNRKSSSKCLNCYSGYGVAEDGTCSACSSDCLACSTVTQCTYCTEYMYGPKFDDSGECGPCASNCSYCQINGAGDCDSSGCSSGYVYSEETRSCHACPVNCTSCVFEGPCLYCNYGMALNNETGECEACAPNCSMCTENGPRKCDRNGCMYQMGLLPDKTCGACAPECSYCGTNGAGKCDIYGCWYGMGLLPNQTCGECNTAGGCSSCNQVSQCNYCYNSTYGPLKDGSGACEPCSSGCHYCNINGAYHCDPYGCNDGYVYSYETKDCAKCPDNCVYCYPNNGVCTECISGFGVSNDTGLCVECEDSHCESCDGGFCQECDYGYGLTSSGQCVGCVPYCQECTVNGGGLCDPQGCISQYGFDPDTQTCKQCSLNCDQCQPDIDLCTACTYGYGVSKTTGLCTKCSEYCSSCTTNGGGFCDYCYSGYALLPDKTCAACSEYCYYCRVPGECESYDCYYGYQFNYTTRTCQYMSTTTSTTQVTESTVLESTVSETFTPTETTTSIVTIPGSGSNCAFYSVSNSSGQISSHSEFQEQYSGYSASYCIENCIQTKGCKSINFDSKTKQCYFINSESGSSSSLQATNTSFTHYEFEGVLCTTGGKD